MKKKYIYIALSIMIVGLAVTATNLFINGGVRIASLEENFDIYFSSGVLDDTNCYSCPNGGILPGTTCVF